MSDELLINSRLNPTGNGSNSSSNNPTPPTSGQKWWIAILIGFIFFIISSPAALYATSWVFTSLGGEKLYNGQDPRLALLLTQTIIFIVIIRLLLH